MSEPRPRIRIGGAAVDHVLYEARNRGPKAAVRVLLRRFRVLFANQAFKRLYPQVTWGKDIEFDGKVRIVGYGRVTFGDRVWFASFGGVANEFSVVSPDASITVADDAGFNGASLTAAAGIHVGKGSLLGACHVMDSDFHSTTTGRRESADTGIAAPIFIGDDVWIGNGATILRGVTIGDHAVIGAGAVVRSDVAARAIVVGNPQRIVGEVPKAEDAAPE